MSRETVPGPEPERTTLYDFIDANREDILVLWARAVRASANPASELSQPVLIDHMPALLERIAAITRTAHGGGSTDFEQQPEIHALDRLDRGFDLQLVVDEYAALRASALELYRERYGLEVVSELQRFDLAIDRAIRTSVTQFSRARERLLASLDRISTAALGEPDVSNLLPRLLSALLESAEAVDSVTILLLEGDHLRVRAAVGLTSERDARFTLKVGEGFSGTIAATREPLGLRDAANDPLVVSRHIREKKLRALYGVPLLAGNELVGVAHIGSLTAYEFSVEDRYLFRTTATRAAQLIGEAGLREEKARAVEQLRVQHAQYEAVLTALADFGQGLTITDGFRLTFINEAFCKLTGYGSAELAALEDIRTLMVEPAPEELAGLFADTAPHRYEAVLKRKDGELRRVEITAKPIGVGQRVVLSRDVTEVRRQSEEIRSSIAFRDQLIGILSHDLRNPLTAIRATAQVLVLGRSGPADVRKLSQRIDAAAKRMGDMIGGILDFTQARFRGALPVYPAPTDLQALCTQVVDETRTAFTGALIEAHYRGDLRGTWDPDRLAQLIANLLSNAITHGAPDQPVVVDLDGTGAEVRLDIHNEGEPIPPELLPRLFEAFTRGARPGRQTGFGLGLYIADQVVRAHGGTIEVRSSAATGTSFAVSLPREPPARAGASGA